ncbi:uncharacterized protein [Tiliqua scincoides]|uniref:uncharacterized protein isoform X3 n=1 Tax=Tiliqua scincoides TaxID=71010 RepID=UPI0034631E9E
MVEKKPALEEVLALLSSLLGLPQHKSGLKLKKMQKLLLTKEGVDLEKFSIAQGHKDALAFLECQMPELSISYQENQLDCIIQLGSDSEVNSVSALLDAPPSHIQVPNSVPVFHSSTASQFSASPFFNSERSGNQSKIETESMLGKQPGSYISTSAQVSTPLSLNSKESSIKSETLNQRKVEKKPALEDVLSLLSSLLSTKGYASGLRLRKVQKMLLTKEGVDLEKFSIAQGYRDSLTFLECHMPELNISYQEDRLDCVIRLGSGPPAKTFPLFPSAPTSLMQTTKAGSCISTLTQVSAPLSSNSGGSSFKSETSNRMKVGKKPAALEDVLSLLSSLLSTKGYASGLRLRKVQKMLLAKEGVDLEKFSIAQGYRDSLAFLECHMPELNISYQEDRLDCVIRLGSGSCISSSTQACTPLSLKQASIKSEPSNQRKVEKKRALAEVSALLYSLFSSNQYPLGLRLKKVQELLLTKKGFNLEKFSIAQGHKDSLAFLECHSDSLAFLGCPLMIRYQNDRLSCVIQLGSGFGYLAKPISTSHDFSANRSCIQTLSAPSVPIPNLLVAQNSPSAFSGKDKSSSQPQSDVSVQLSSECQLRRFPPMEELLSLSNVQLLGRPNLTEPHHSKDLDELKQEVAYILARHPEGVSLFRFRAEYSAAFQKHLPLGNASSAKQCLLQMPDVVCLKGYGVQTLLFPVSSSDSSLKSGQRIISGVEDAVAVPRHSLSKAVTVANPVVVFQPSPPKAVVRPCTTHSLTSGYLSEPGNTEGSVLPQSEMPRAPKPTAHLQEHGMARAKLGDLSGQSHLSNAAETAVAPDCSLSKTDPVVVPKSSAPKATMAPVPQPRSFHHLYSECFKPVSNKESCPHPETLPQRAHKAAAPEEEQVMNRARSRGTPLLPASPVVFPSDWGEMSDGFVSKPTHLTKPWVSDKSARTPSLSQPLPASFMPWMQPLVFPPITFLNQHVPPPSLASAHNTSRLQPQNVTSQSSHPAQTVPQMRPVQPTSPLRSTEQRNYVYAAQGPDGFSQEQMSSRTVIHAQSQTPVFSVDGLPAPLSPQNPSSTCAFRSQIYQTERYHHPWLDGPQCRPMRTTVSAVDNSIVTTSSARAPSHSETYWSQSIHGKPLVTSPSTPPSRLPHAPTVVSQQPSYASRDISTHSSTPSSVLQASAQPCEPQTLSISNRDPQAFRYPQYVERCSTVSSTRPASSLNSPVYFPTNTSGQPTYTSYNSTTDYGAPNQMKPFLATSKPAEKQGNHYVTWADKQKPRLTQRPTESYSPAFQNSPPPKSPAKCVIL